MQNQSWGMWVAEIMNPETHLRVCIDSYQSARRRTPSSRCTPTVRRHDSTSPSDPSCRIWSLSIPEWSSHTSCERTESPAGASRQSAPTRSTWRSSVAGTSSASRRRADSSSSTSWGDRRSRLVHCVGHRPLFQRWRRLCV